MPETTRGSLSERAAEALAVTGEESRKDERCGRDVGGPRVATYFHFICRKPKGHAGPHAWKGYQ